ncbi:MAG: heparinase II/III family protein [Clostridia bacterium]|nr:heparinase II/III family protein [Clostridia bacterium]MBN2883284.1 heparinase II/III family protein [Clostridia bacterium]
MVDWKQVREKINNYKWAEELYRKMKTDATVFIDSYHDDASRTAGWGHNYHCDKCAGRLAYDINSPHEHKCTVCGKINTGSKKDNAWTATYRGQTFGTIYNSGILYSLDRDNKYPDFAKKALNFFSENYNSFTAESPAKRFEGKLTGINLSDAVNIIQCLLGMDMMRECFKEEELNAWHDKLFIPQAEMYDQFSNKIYNIPAWMKAAEGMIGLFFDDRKIIDNAVYSRFGLLDQMRRGVTKEGMWFEYSPHYHFYCADPITYFMYMAKEHNLYIPETDELFNYLERLYMYPVENMFSNGFLPNPGDGWPEIHVNKYKRQIEYAAQILNNDYLKQILGTFYKEGEASVPERLLFNPGYPDMGLPSFGSQNNEDSFNAILKNNITEVFLKTGIKTISHAHPDVMTIEMAFYGDLVSCDLCSNGYSTRIFQEWQRKTIAHNTVILDMMDQKYEPVGEGVWPEGIVEYFDESRIRAKSKNVYECCDYTRDIRIEENTIYDEFHVKGVEEYNIEWLFYCKGKIECSYETEVIGSLGDSEGYQHLFDVRKFSGEFDWSIDFEMNDKTVTLDFEGMKGTEVFLVNSYTTDFNTTRPGVIVRRKGSETLFKAKYTCTLKG